MKILKGITNLMLLVLCGIFISNINILAQCNVEIGNNQGSFNGETDICLGENLSMTAAVENGTPPYFYEWSNGEVVESIVIENLDYGEIVFSITVTDSEGCQTSDEVVIMVNAIAVAALNPTECSIMYSVYDDVNGNGLQDVDEIPIEGATANLLFPDGVTTITEVTNANGVAQFSDLPAGSYMVFIIYEECVNTQSINMSGCNDICNVMVNDGEDLQICEDDIAFLTAFATGGEPPYTYQWSTGETTQSISVSPSETTTYGVTVTDMESCIVNDEVSLEVSNMSLNLTTLPMPDCISAGTQTQIYSAVMGGNPPYFYEWSNGENENIIFVTISESTTYTLTVTDASGCQIVESISFEIEDCGECDITVDAGQDQQICIGTMGILTALTNDGTPLYTYNWSTGEVTQTISVFPSENTTYGVTVTDNDGCMAIDEVTVNILEININLESITNPSFCNGNDGMIVLSGLEANTDYAMVVDDVLINGTTDPNGFFIITGLSAGTYSDIFVEIPACISNTVSATLTEPVAPFISIESIIDPTTCNGNDGAILLSGLWANEIYVLNFNDGQQVFQVALITDANGNIVLSDLPAGTYSDIFVSLNGCISNTVSATLTEQAAPTINVNEPYCDGNNAIIEITGLLPATTYDLNFDYNEVAYTPFSVPTNALGTISLTNLEAGFYSNFVVSDGVCESVAAVTVEVQDCSECNVNVALVTQPNSAFPYCINTEMEVFPNPTNGEMPYTYEWSNGQTTPILSLTLTENITYTLSVTDANGCMAIESINFEVQDCGECDLTVNLGDDLLICGNESANISSTATGGTPPYFYEWSETGMGQSANTAVPNNVSGTYSVTVTDFNGCIAVDEIEVIASNLEANIAMEWSEPFCQTDSIVYSAFVSSNNAEPYTYLWTVDGVPVSTSQSFILQVLQENYTVAVEVSDNNGCVVIDEKPLVGISCNYVWPGDANNDGIANNNDVLQIGLAYGTEGVERFDASTDWTEQYCTNWETSFEDGLNHNFGDCDGNGTINDDDVAVVDLNYGQVHGKNEGENGTENDIPLFCELPENIVSGGSYSLPIKLGNDNISATDIYGIAFTISVTMEEDFELLEPQINFNESWLGTQGFDMITLDKNVNTNEWDIALARTDQTNVSGSGQLCSIDCIMEVGSLKNETVLSVPVSVSFSNVTLINAQALEILTNPITTQAEVISSIGETENVLTEIAVYPNPATDILYIDNPNHENLAITIMNILGQNVFEQNISANENRSTIDVGHLESGCYLVKIEEQNKQKTYKLWID